MKQRSVRRLMIVRQVFSVVFVRKDVTDPSHHKNTDNARAEQKEHELGKQTFADNQAVVAQANFGRKKTYNNTNFQNHLQCVYRSKIVKIIIFHRS